MYTLVTLVFSDIVKLHCRIPLKSPMGEVVGVGVGGGMEDADGRLVLIHSSRGCIM